MVWGSVFTSAVSQKDNMETEMERRRADAESDREREELVRHANERARVAAEAARVNAEDGRRAVTEEVTETVKALKTLLNRMEAVEAMRRRSHSGADPH